MKTTAYLVFLLPIFGCTQKEANNIPSFESIDYSFFTGYSQSIKILKDGTTYISDSSGFSCNRLFFLRIDKAVLDSLSELTNLLLSLNPDSIYFAEDCDHPFPFSLIIKTKERVISTSYNGDQTEPQLSTLFSISEYLGSICKDKIEQLDSNFNFESKPKLLLPPPPPSRSK